MADSCGDCSLCCKLLGVTALQKAPGRWCIHVARGGKGCSIYSARPAACRTFQCLWLQSQNGPEGITPLSVLSKPNKSHVVLTLQTRERHKALFAMTDPGYPRAFLQQPIRDYLLTAFNDGLIVVAGFSRDLHTIIQGTEPTFIKLIPDRPIVIDAEGQLAIRMKAAGGIQVGYIQDRAFTASKAVFTY